mmetsp:Transcript_91142/g.208942  ORF Transcript_91142/g.208942 Transcript_91142/m.208942 type:complete len:211 (+) Transcript_91142:1197-1829(+)
MTTIHIPNLVNVGLSRQRSTHMVAEKDRNHQVLHLASCSCKLAARLHLRELHSLRELRMPHSLSLSRHLKTIDYLRRNFLLQSAAVAPKANSRRNKLSTLVKTLSIVVVPVLSFHNLLPILILVVVEESVALQAKCVLNTPFLDRVYRIGVCDDTRNPTYSAQQNKQQQHDAGNQTAHRHLLFLDDDTNAPTSTSKSVRAGQWAQRSRVF